MFPKIRYNSHQAKLQENMNPALNAPSPATANNGMGAVGGRFDAFADQNPFTMKMLDAYVFSSLL